LRSHLTNPSCCARRNSRPSLTNSSDWVSVRSADATRFAGSLKNRSTSASHSSRQSAFVPPMMRWDEGDRKSTRLNSSHDQISYAVFCLKKKRLYIFNRRSFFLVLPLNARGSLVQFR